MGRLRAEQAALPPLMAIENYDFWLRAALRELIIQAQDTGHWAIAGTPEQLADAIEERYRAGVLDLLTLHGLGNPDQEDALLNGLLPELRRRLLIDSDYVGNDFRSNLELPPLPLPGFAAARSA